MSPRLVLVTGGAGFVGLAVCRAFAAAGDRVTALVRPGTGAMRVAALPAVVERAECDLAREPQRLVELLRSTAPAVVVHAAARDAYAAHDLAATAIDNVMGTAQLLAALATLPQRPRLVAVGGSTEYGRAAGPIAESAPLAPVTPRGATKAAASLLVLSEHAAGRIEGGVLRPFTVYGPWEAPVRLIPTAIRAALLGEELPLTSHDAAHDLVFVDDVAAACLLAATAPRFPGSAWNVCAGKPISNQRLLDEIERATGRTLHRRSHAFAARPLDRPDWFGDPRRTLEGLGWCARTSLAEGLAVAVAFWRQALGTTCSTADPRRP